MTASTTARERARFELTAEILGAARRQLVEHGAQQLSLRAVARELGMASSAVYRYFPSRDDLLTALIVEAYAALADHASTAESGVSRSDYRGRWRVACRAVRGWAVEHPHEYALVYGSPVPGYQAPEATIEPASRVSLLLLVVVRDASSADVVSGPDVAPRLRPRIAADLRAQLDEVSAAVAPEVPADVLARTLVAWTQLFGAVSFELFGHLIGSVDPSGPFFDHCVEQMADLIGLPRQG